MKGCNLSGSAECNLSGSDTFFGNAEGVEW